MNNKTFNLENFIKEKVTVATFEQLPQKLNISQHKFTRILNHPPEARLDDVLNLAALLKVTPCLLIDSFKMGHANITLDDYEQYKQLDKVA